MNNVAILRVLIVLCMCGCILAAYPLLLAFGQSATDAVQSEQIRTLDARLSATERRMEEVIDKMNWALGGVAGIYGLLGIIGIFNFKLIAKK